LKSRKPYVQLSSSKVKAEEVEEEEELEESRRRRILRQ
jgi:hypothetical protein